jgi:hypothetical protein
VLAEGSTDGDWTARWENQGAACTIRVKGASGTQLFSGKGPGPIPGEDGALVLIRRRGTRAVFEVTHEFEKM